MPLTLLIVSSILLLVLIVGGILACRGVTHAVDGYEDEEGFHPLISTEQTARESVIRDGEGDPMSVRA